MTLSGGTGLCGGSLVAPRTVLTAAHCIDVSVDVTTILGAQFLAQNEPNQQRFRVQGRENLIIHPEWTPSLIRNDVGLVRLAAPAQINEFVRTVRLATGLRLFENDPATVSGWGRFDDNLPQASDVLQFYRGTILSMANCRLRFPGGIIQDSNICLSGLNNGGACQGDSGKFRA